MVRTELPLTGGAYTSRSLPISSQQCINFYVHLNQGGGLAQESLWGTPGLTQLVTTGVNQQVNRGAHNMNDVPYFVNGTKLYRLDRTVDGLGAESFSTTDLGTIEGTGPVSTADNGKQLCIMVPGGKGYIYDRTVPSLVEITDADFRASGDPQHVVFIDGYFLFNTDEKKFIISALNDGTSYNALDFGSAETDPDAIVVPVVSRNQLYICGTETIDVFRNVGGSGFPFARADGAGFSIGVFAAFSVENFEDSFFFIGGATNDRPSVYQVSGGSYQIVSHDGINVILEGVSETDLAAVTSFSYSEAGARFIGWNLPTTTIVYEVVTKKWHERKSRFNENYIISDERWRVNSVIKGYSRLLVADNKDGRIGEMSLDQYGEYGNDIISTVSTIPFSNIGQFIKFPMLELTCESGVGNSVVTDPKVRMQRSLDGKTWTDSRTQSLGKIGEYNKRQIWWRNGAASRFESFRFIISDQVKKVLIKLEADIV